MQTLTAHGEYRSAQRFKWQLSLPGEIPSRILCVSGQIFLQLGYGFQKLSFQSVWVVSHRHGLLEIALKAKPPIFSNLSSVFSDFFEYLQSSPDCPLDVLGCRLS
jgi:hypothetical protein